MSIPPMAQAMIGQEHTEENWLRGWKAGSASTVAGPLGIELIAISKNECTLRMPITDAARQPFGLLHGGVSMVLAETAASMHACWGVDLTQYAPVGIEINGSHLRSATEGHVLAKCRVVRRAQTLIVHEIDIVHEETGRKLNVSRVTNLYTRSPLAKRG